MKKYFVLLFLFQLINCETDLIKIPIHVSYSVEPWQPDKYSDYIDMTEISNLFFEENDAQVAN